MTLAELREYLKTHAEDAVLDLSNKQLTNEHASAIADFLKSNTKIKKLNLTNNKLKPEGAEIIAQGVKVNQTLQSLDLTNTYLRDEGNASILEAIDSNSSLKEISLNGNFLGPLSKKYFKKIFSDCKFEKISLKNTLIQGFFDEIPEYLKTNKTLKILDLSDNLLHEDHLVKLAEALPKNETIIEICIDYTKVMGFPSKIEPSKNKIQECLHKNKRKYQIVIDFEKLADDIQNYTPFNHEKKLKSNIQEETDAFMTDLLKYTKTFETNIEYTCFMPKIPQLKKTVEEKYEIKNIVDFFSKIKNEIEQRNYTIGFFGNNWGGKEYKGKLLTKNAKLILETIDNILETAPSDPKQWILRHKEVKFYIKQWASSNAWLHWRNSQTKEFAKSLEKNYLIERKNS